MWHKVDEHGTADRIEFNCGHHVLSYCTAAIEDRLHSGSSSFSTVWFIIEKLQDLEIYDLTGRLGR